MRKTVNELKRFILIGLVSTALNFIIFAFLYKINLPILIASFSGYILGMSTSFYFGKTWVFKDKSILYKEKIIKFLIIYALGAIGMMLIIDTLDSKTLIDYRIIWFFGTFFAFLNNFIGSKVFVFSSRNKFSTKIK